MDTHKRAEIGEFLENHEPTDSIWYVRKDSGKFPSVLFLIADDGTIKAKHGMGCHITGTESPRRAVGRKCLGFE